jgi:hypothetical protein
MVSATGMLIFNKKLTRQIVKFCFFSISTVLDNNTGNLSPPSRGNQSHTGKLLFVSLAVVCIMIGNTYKAIITRDIISPLQNRISYEKIADLTGFLFGVLPNKNVIEADDWTLEKVKNASMYEDFINYPKAAFDYNVMFSSFGEELANLFMITPYHEEVDTTLADKPYEEYYNRTFIHHSAEGVFHFLSDCSKKRAFIGFKNEIEEFMKYGDAKEVFAFGKDEFLSVEYFWQIPYGIGGYLHRRMSSIISSGICGLWESIYYSKNRNDLDLSLKVTLEKTQTLRSKLGALFLLQMFGLGAASAVFLVELLIGCWCSWASRIIKHSMERFRALKERKCRVV